MFFAPGVPKKTRTLRVGGSRMRSFLLAVEMAMAVCSGMVAAKCGVAGGGSQVHLKVRGGGVASAVAMGPPEGVKGESLAVIFGAQG